MSTSSQQVSSPTATVDKTPMTPIVQDQLTQNEDLKEERIIKTPSSEETDDINTGRWTSKEHEQFLLGYKKYGKDWKRISELLGTRSNVQCRTHAQKFFKKRMMSEGNNRDSGAESSSDEESVPEPVPKRQRLADKLNIEPVKVAKTENRAPNPGMVLQPVTMNAIDFIKGKVNLPGNVFQPIKPLEIFLNTQRIQVPVLPMMTAMGGPSGLTGATMLPPQLMAVAAAAYRPMPYGLGQAMPSNILFANTAPSLNMNIIASPFRPRNITAPFHM